MTRITSHVLDTSAGQPAPGVAVRLERLDAGGSSTVASATTDADGRVRDWLPEGVPAGRYRLVFETGAWFRAAGRSTLYSEIVIHFYVESGTPHYHLPLLLAPFGYSTYRGS
jgi:5-hydroxyisourate hydrolase